MLYLVALFHPEQGVVALVALSAAQKVQASVGCDFCCTASRAV